MAAPTRTPLIAGNWKLNNTHLEAISLVQKLAFSFKDADFEHAEVAVLPPFTALRSVQTLVDGDKLRIVYGAQDISQHEHGAYTGEISGAMLAKLGCTYALAGHSERREHHNEDDAIVNGKVRAAFASDMTPILCLGEGPQIRKAGDQVSYTVAQLDGALADVPEEQAARLVVAYEPVWAIGTGEVATPEDAQEVCAALRARLGELYSEDVAGAVRILYGGSVKAGNIAGIMAQDDVDGALVGGASLKPDEFVSLVRFRDQE